MPVSDAETCEMSRVVEAEAEMTRPPLGGQSSLFPTRTEALEEAIPIRKLEPQVSQPSKLSSPEDTRAKWLEEDVVRVNLDPLGASAFHTKDSHADGTGVSGKSPFTNGDRGVLEPSTFQGRRDRWPEVISRKNAEETLPRFEVHSRLCGWSQDRRYRELLDVCDRDLRTWLQSAPSARRDWAFLSSRVFGLPTLSRTQTAGLLSNMKINPGESIRDWHCRVSDTACRGYPPGPGRDDAILVTLVGGLSPAIKREVSRFDFTSIEEALGSIERAMVAEELYAKETRSSGKPAGLRCYSCGRQGHIQRNCRETSGKSPLFASMPIAPEGTITLSISINGITERAIVDTGSSISVLDECVVAPHTQTAMESTKVVSITGEEVVFNKVAIITFQIDNRHIEASFRVRKGMPCRVLLGCDVLQKVGGYIDLINRTVHFSSPPSASWLWQCHISRESLTNNIMSAYPQVFATSDNELGSCAGVQHHIKLHGTPKRVVYRSVPVRLRETLKTLLDDMLRVGVIRPSHSPYSAPVLLRPKKDGSYRVCVDYRLLNDTTEADAYPTPRPTEAVQRMHGAKIFSKLDLQSGYWQIPMASEDISKTAFTTPFGLFEFTKMPFGLKTAPATFQRAMDQIFGNPTPPFMVVYMDDILVFSRDEQEHKQHLGFVLDKLSQAGLKVKPSKCELFAENVNYVGHDLSSNGVSVAREKYDTISNYPTPTSIKSIRSFLGFVGYYRSHIKDFAHLAEPLHAMSRKGAHFEWTDQCDEAFQRLKTALINSTALAYPDFSQEFHIKTDASDVAIGGVLEQERDGKPVIVECASRVLSSAERNYSTTEKEALAIVWAISKYRPYIWGHRFVVWTDHNPLTHLRTAKDSHGRLTRWYLALQEYDFIVKYIPGKHNFAADALSRPADMTEKEVCRMGSFPAQLYQKIKENTQRSFPQNNRPVKIRHTALTWADNLLIRELQLSGSTVRQIYVPKQVRMDVLALLHDEWGHFGEQKTFELVRDRFYWPGYEIETRRYVRGCESCQRAATPRIRDITPMDMTPQGANDLVEWDITGPIRDADSTPWHLLVMLDLYTKWVEVAPLNDTSAASVAETFHREWVSRYGPPRQLHNDQGANFCSVEVERMCEKYGIKHTRTSAYNPQGNGGVERFNRTLKDRLRRSLTDRTQWRVAITSAVEAYRMTPHSSLGCSPYEKTFGRVPVTQADRLMRRLPQPVPRKARQPKTTPPDMCKISVGQKVWARNNTRINKLDTHWLGPYKVVALPGPNAVQLEDDHGYRWVTNVRQIKPYVDRRALQSPSDRRTRRRPSYLDEYVTAGGSASDNDSDSTLPAIDLEGPTTHTVPPLSLSQVTDDQSGHTDEHTGHERTRSTGPPEGEVCERLL